MHLLLLLPQSVCRELDLLCRPQVLVERLTWLPAGVFLELLALCQCLPGPSSTQLSFALGITQQGATGGLVSGERCSLRV